VVQDRGILDDHALRPGSVLRERYILYGMYIPRKRLSARGLNVWKRCPSKPPTVFIYTNKDSLRFGNTRGKLRRRGVNTMSSIQNVLHDYAGLQRNQIATAEATFILGRGLLFLAVFALAVAPFFIGVLAAGSLVRGAETPLPHLPV
jgi:hypothetical protein